MDSFVFNSKAYKTSRCTEADARLPHVRRMLSPAGLRVLDLGCLDGTIGSVLTADGHRVSGVDASKPAIEKAIARGLDARIGNLEEPLPFESESFDAVFAGEIVEHIFKVEVMLDEMRRVLKPGGFAVITTPNLAALGRRLLLLFNRNPLVEIDFSKPEAAGHIRYFIWSTLERLLEEHGFKVVERTSDLVNFNASGSVSSRWLARCFPSIGRSLIVKAVRV